MRNAPPGESSGPPACVCDEPTPIRLLPGAKTAGCDRFLPVNSANSQSGTATSALARAVERSATVDSEPHHPSENSLRDLILGGQDGLVNMLGIVLGVVAANGTTQVLIAAGLAAAITE